MFGIAPFAAAPFAALGVIGAITSFLVGDASAIEASQIAITAILGMTMRNAIGSVTNG